MPDYKQDKERKGTEIPTAVNPLTDRGGYTFDIQRAMPFNVVIDDPITGTKIIPIAGAALDKLHKAKGNNNKRITYEEASDPTATPFTTFVRPDYNDAKEKEPEVIEEEEVKEVLKDEPVYVPPPMEDPKLDVQSEFKRMWEEAHAQREQEEFKETVKAAEKVETESRDDFIRKEVKIDANDPPKVKLRIKGSFGGLSVNYNVVYKYDIYLVAIQYNTDEAFYEVPNSGELLNVTWNGKTYSCYSGPQFPLGEGSKVMITVFLIEGKTDD